MKNYRMSRMIDEGEIYTREELEELGLVDTHQKFAGLLIYKRKDERYLLEPVGENKFKIRQKYQL